MISFKDYFYSSDEQLQEDSFTVNITGTEDGEEKNYNVSVEADSDEEAKEVAGEKIESMKANGSLPDDATIQNIES